MRQLKFFLFLVVVGTSVQGMAQGDWVSPSSQSVFCVQNFNAYGPIYASDVAERTEDFTDYLKKGPACDVIHLQEVWNKSQIEQVESQLQDEFSVSAPNKADRIGLMSLVKGEIHGRQTIRYQVNNEGGVLDSIRKVFKVKKAFHVLKANLPQLGEEIYFINTHLHPTSQTVRLTQIVDLLEWRLQFQNKKMILTGDFNSDIKSLERQSLMVLLGLHDSMEEFLGKYPQNYCTYCVANPLGWMLENHTFDYIFFSNVGTSSSELKAIYGDVNMRGYEGAPWSDHYGVRVHFQLNQDQVKVSATELEYRRTLALQVLKVLRKVFSSDKDLKVYAEKTQSYIQELENKQGRFNAYFEKYRKKESRVDAN